MNKLLTLALGVCLTCVLASNAMASNDIVTASDHEAILEIAKGFGSADLSVASKGTPVLKGRMEGTKYAIWFSGCSEGNSCSALQFLGVWKIKNFSQEKINTWNTQKMYSKAYIDKDGDLILEMDVFMRYGMTKKNLEEVFDLWQTSLKHFSRQLSQGTQPN